MPLEQRLHHVIEQMTEADRDEEREDGVVALPEVGWGVLAKRGAHEQS
jgi:hypothetical protein